MESKCCFYGYYTDYTAPSQIIAGTTPKQYFGDINYLIKMLSNALKKEKLGNISVVYKDKKCLRMIFLNFKMNFLYIRHLWNFKIEQREKRKNQVRGDNS